MPENPDGKGGAAAGLPGRTARVPAAGCRLLRVPAAFRFNRPFAGRSSFSGDFACAGVRQPAKTVFTGGG
ncbi:hypothetical protein B4135_1931 [Caldibacillus debilis]|uniref:Uncharacterized protein n=1 Tax=Caldibacillus debilis TaxID=301148 RepID=A0A150M721_9BACI|nr:hypothetical protein B4135_1931 [Caldibacillus debilis]